ncbi:MAG: hypothetical protein MUP85_24965 [Candidatus Lokiarchaeota archaeon]|nr:hypothetical protein [Candidatus Lokiarchaeota archaeon]
MRTQLRLPARRNKMKAGCVFPISRDNMPSGLIERLIMKLLIFSFFLILFGCNNVVSTNSEGLTSYGNISNIDWQIESIVIKEGTDNPDEIVPADQMTLINSGEIIQGKIILNEDHSITVKENEPEFYFSFYIEYQWELLDENFIRFTRYDNNGNIIQGFGYNVRFIFGNKMQWYSVGVGIESGIKIVKIITLYYN